MIFYNLLTNRNKEVLMPTRQDRIKKVMSNVFNIDVDTINNESSPDNIENWDSLKHMNLIVALEEEFNLEFSDDEVIEIMNYKLVIEAVKNHEG
jgi:acyl carrier protein